MFSLFIAHGNPMNAIQANPFCDDWCQLLQPLEKPPRAVLMVSAHWCTLHQTCLSTARYPQTLHDFGGFPPALYQQQYACPGAPELLDDLHKAGLNTIQASPEQGLDHGAWMVMQALFPRADIPCAQLSLNMSLSASQHWQLAEQLSHLQQDNVLLIGSGNIVHNIPKWIENPHDDGSWAKAFDQAVLTALQQHNVTALCNYSSLPSAADAVPTPEHYLPLLYAYAYCGSQAKMRSSDFTHYTLETASMRSLRFTPC